jgi:hypothetical protein
VLWKDLSEAVISFSHCERHCSVVYLAAQPCLKPKLEMLKDVTCSSASTSKLVLVHNLPSDSPPHDQSLQLCLDFHPIELIDLIAFVLWAFDSLFQTVRCDSFAFVCQQDGCVEVLFKGTYQYSIKIEASRVPSRGKACCRRFRHSGHFLMISTSL